MQEPTARETRGGALLGAKDSNMATHGSVHGGQNMDVAETRCQGESGLSHSSQDTSLEPGPSVARPSSAWRGHGGRGERGWERTRI